MAITPLNHSVIFLREAHLVLSSGHWRAVISFDLQPYEEVFNILHADLYTVRKVTERTTPVGEVRHIKITLHAIESKLSD
jgi:hypothetical protein